MWWQVVGEKLVEGGEDHFSEDRECVSNRTSIPCDLVRESTHSKREAAGNKGELKSKAAFYKHKIYLKLIISPFKKNHVQFTFCFVI